MDGYYQLVVKLLRKAGYSQMPGGKGSHEKWSNGKHTTTVPRNLTSKFTANAIVKGAGINHKF